MHARSVRRAAVKSCLHGACAVPDLRLLCLRTHTLSQTVIVPKIAPIQRTITEHMQGAREAASGQFHKSELGRRLSERAMTTVKDTKTEAWEKEVIARIEAQPAAAKK